MALPISYNIRNLRERWQVTFLAVLGISLVVAVLVVLLAMVAGVRLALRSTGIPQNAIVVQRGSASELTSWVPLDQRNLIVVDSRVARGADGRPLASPEIVVVSSKPRRADGQPTNVTMRGVSPRAFEVRGGIEIVRGRNFTPGLYEVIVGERIAERIRGLDLGAKITVQRKEWDIVGIFRSQGGGFESEIWGDIDAMGPAFQRTGGSNSLVVRMADPAAIPDFDRTIRADPQMQLQAVNERKYYEDQAGPVAAGLTGLTTFVAIVMGIGAVFGAMNTMYAIVAARTREIGTLRALGFSRRSVLFSFVIESVFLALLGGVIGVLMALPANNLGGATGVGFAELAFAFKITPQAIAIGLVFAAVMGLIGGLLPAARAARLPITSALRAA
ncbi:MAG TPA: ABC transporter permease [Vicinamibacteria bacterium]|nr:ABC transporter permease [Vicinamibacteria bacterium]